MNIGMLGGIAFVVGLAIGTGAVMMRPAAPPAHGTADSTAVAGHDSTAAHPAAAEAAAATPSHEDPPVVGHETPAEASPVRVPVLATVSAAAAAPEPENFTQVSKILSSMKPAEAAKILVYLSDDQVEGILRSLGVRQAAQMLTQLPTERAAALSRRLLHTNPEKAQ